MYCEVTIAYVPRHVLELRQFAKTGVPASLRPAVWQQILRLDAAGQRHPAAAAAAGGASTGYFQALSRQARVLGKLL